MNRAHDAPPCRRRKTLLCALLLTLLATGPAPAQELPDYTVQTLAAGLRWPWSVARLPDGGFLVTEREGRLLLVLADGSRQVLQGTPDTLFAGQGGYFDVVLHPQFEDNGLLYLSYAEGVEDANTLAVFRARLVDGELREGATILRVAPLKSTPQHYGGRLLFTPDETLLITTGDGFEHREEAQNIDVEMGKVLRVTGDGGAAPGNPFDSEASERIWSYGHRNPQGLAYDPELQRVYLHEHGPRGGDEVNVIEKRGNYGWPAVTHGVDYSGAYVSPFVTAPDMIDPLWVWVPSIAPSGLAIYRGDSFPHWRGSLLVGALVDRELRLLRMQDGEVAQERSLLGELGERIRDVRVFDGNVFVLTDSVDGQLLQLLPVR